VLVDVEEPIKLALAILNDVVGVILTTNAEVLDVLTITAEPLVVAVALLKIVTVSVLDDVVL
jgi:hypothetical protein